MIPQSQQYSKNMLVFFGCLLKQAWAVAIETPTVYLHSSRCEDKQLAPLCALGVVKLGIALETGYRQTDGKLQTDNGEIRFSFVVPDFIRCQLAD
jgi:hypothetical protein